MNADPWKMTVPDLLHARREQALLDELAAESAVVAAADDHDAALMLDDESVTGDATLFRTFQALVRARARLRLQRARTARALR